MLNRDQAVYLATHEQIEPQYEEQYLNLMMDGECEIILLSNYCAIEKVCLLDDR